MTPAQAIEYLDHVAELDDAPPCRHGHFGCAAAEGGTCSNEVWAEHACSTCGEIDDGSGCGCEE